MSNQGAHAEANRLIEEHGLYQAYALVKNRMVREENNWHWLIDYEKIANDQLILNELTHLLATEAMERQGWEFAKPSEGEPAEWSLSPYEWEFDEMGTARCPFCRYGTEEDEYTGKSVMSPFCPKCGYRLSEPTSRFPEAVPGDPMVRK